jgi:Fe-S-cluster containining protein
VDECIGCGNCCSRHWLLKLSSAKEIAMFPSDKIVFGNFIWTDECPFHVNNKCEIHDNKPFKCNEFSCEGRPIKK